MKGDLWVARNTTSYFSPNLNIKKVTKTQFLRFYDRSWSKERTDIAMSIITVRLAKTLKYTHHLKLTITL